MSYTTHNMKTLVSVAIFSVCVLSAQAADFSGVWKANAEKSKVNGPAPANQLVIIEQKDTKLSETIGISSPRGEQRSAFTYNLDGKPSNNTFRGLPMRTESKMDGNSLVLTSKVAGGPPMSMVDKWTLSSDRNTLTVETAMNANGKESTQTLVLEKQPDSAGEPLRKPEQTAGARFKNVMVLKDLPGSQLLDSMRSFNMSLGVDCEHCHVQGKFDADEKPAKAMARKMITMTHNINETTFEGKNEIRCYTCHKGIAHPQSRPAFN